MYTEAELKEVAAAMEKPKRKPYTEKDVDNMFNSIMNSGLYNLNHDDQKTIYKAYEVARRIHKGQKRHTGDAFIYHLVEVMRIVLQDIGLGPIGAVAALLHEITFQTDLKIEDIEQMFGKKIASIVDSLARIKGTSEYFKDSEPDVYKKIILGLADDIRIILVKLADRLANMRTLDVENVDRQYKLSYETMQIYVPIAHRLGISKIKTELENLCLKYLNRKAYNEISELLGTTEQESKRYINHFTLPIIAMLTNANINFDIKGRPKSIYSIYNKITKKKVSFEEVYDRYAIRIIFNPHDPEKENEECLKIASIISSHYKIHPDRTRDWITTPKSNGYQAYHITVFDSERTQWVEIQIRSKKMDEIAEYGFAAHWKYKGLEDKKMEFDDKIKMLKQKLEDPTNKDFDFLSNFKMLMSNEISVYSTDGSITSLPFGATVLDYAYILNPEKARHLIGAKVNRKMETIGTTLKNGDLVEPVTSARTQPKPEWISKVHTRQALQSLKEQLHDYIKEEVAQGQKKVHDLMASYKIDNEQHATETLMAQFNCMTKSDLYQNVANMRIPTAELEQAIKKLTNNRLIRFWKLQFGKEGEKVQDKLSQYINADGNLNINYELAECCNPLPGDEAVGILDREKQTVYIHKKQCYYAMFTIREKPRSFIPVSWKTQKELSGTAKISFEGVDQKGMAQKIITTISQDPGINLKTIHIESEDGSFSGYVEIYVRTQERLEKIVNKLSDSENILSIMVEGEEI